MATVAYTCPFVPVEWIVAHGLEPRRVLPSLRSQRELMRPTAGLCSYARAFVNSLGEPPAADAAVFTTVCDQMRRAAEVFRDRGDVPVFLMNVPSTWRTPGAMELYVDELKRLGDFLVGLGGTAPQGDTLAEIMLRCDDRRRELREARDTIGPRRFAEALCDLGPAATSPEPAEAPPRPNGVPLAIVGGPMLREHLGIFDLLERLGGRAVLDATENGELAVPPPLGRGLVGEQPLAELARVYFGSIPHAMRRPDERLHELLKAELAARNVRGILFHRHPWCDLWHGQLAWVRQEVKLPTLDVDVDEEDPSCTRQAGRLQAFLEMLQ